MSKYTYYIGALVQFAPGSRQPDLTKIDTVRVVSDYSETSKLVIFNTLLNGIETLSLVGFLQELKSVVGVTLVPYDEDDSAIDEQVEAYRLKLTEALTQTLVSLKPALPEGDFKIGALVLMTKLHFEMTEVISDCAALSAMAKEFNALDADDPDYGEDEDSEG